MTIVSRSIVVGLGVMFACATIGPAASMNQTTMPTGDIRIYGAYSKNTDFLTGNLELSVHFARYTKLSGHMNLEYAGQRIIPGKIEATGDIYKITNADEYFAANKGKNGFCHEIIRWLTVRNLEDKDLPIRSSGSIRVSELNIDDWHDYSDDKHDLCGAGTYRLTTLSAPNPAQ